MKYLKYKCKKYHHKTSDRKFLIFSLFFADTLITKFSVQIFNFMDKEHVVSALLPEFEKYDKILEQYLKEGKTAMAIHLLSPSEGERTFARFLIENISTPAEDNLFDWGQV